MGGSGAAGGRSHSPVAAAWDPWAMGAAPAPGASDGQLQELLEACRN